MRYEYTVTKDSGEAEIMKAKDDNCMILIEMDANAKVGSDIIKNDPHSITNNGKIMKI